MTRLNDLKEPIQQAHITYFLRGEKENEKFWSRLGGRPDFHKKILLDIGCGHGSLCVDAAIRGAKRVVGIDTDPERIDFAAAYLIEEFPEFVGRVEFFCCELNDLKKQAFDLILSKDSLEHIIDLPTMMKLSKEYLKVGGRLYVGFGPLFNSPNGDHGRARLILPWLHTLLPEPLIVKYLNLIGKNHIHSIHDLGLNGFSFKEYQDIFKSSGLKLVWLGVNVSAHIISRLFSWIRKIGLFREYFTHNIYAIFEH